MPTSQIARSIFTARKVSCTVAKLTLIAGRAPESICQALSLVPGIDLTSVQLVPTAVNIDRADPLDRFDRSQSRFHDCEMRSDRDPGPRARF